TVRHVFPVSSITLVPRLCCPDGVTHFVLLTLFEDCFGKGEEQVKSSPPELASERCQTWVGALDDVVEDPGSTRSGTPVAQQALC
ncbi:MAG: hypothetical protein Q7V20_00170, partial [Aquabacterium sp.]|uniref:hypothetical protein n=1 Tax=Aquabacterium sp. TaxID=1872578 RepID=UPI0027276D8C